LTGRKKPEVNPACRLNFPEIVVSDADLAGKPVPDGLDRPGLWRTALQARSQDAHYLPATKKAPARAARGDCQHRQQFLNAPTFDNTIVALDQAGTSRSTR